MVLQSNIRLRAANIEGQSYVMRCYIYGFRRKAELDDPLLQNII